MLARCLEVVEEPDVAQLPMWESKNATLARQIGRCAECAGYQESS